MTAPYQIAICDCAGQRVAYEFSTFDLMLLKARELRATIDPKREILVYANQDRVGPDWFGQPLDGLTESEREALEALDPPANTPRPEANLEAASVGDSVPKGPGAPPTHIEGAALGRLKHPHDATRNTDRPAPDSPIPRRLFDHPDLKRIDAYISALNALRRDLTNADREKWSVLRDIDQQAEGLRNALAIARALNSGRKGASHGTQLGG